MPISVGIPFYNNARVFKDALRSVFAQSFQDWELILVDDGSTDDSYLIAESVSLQDPRVKVYRDGENKGVAARRNQLAELAGRDYLAHLDGDDMMHPKRLEHQIAYLTKHTDIDVVGSACYSIDEQNNVNGIRGDDPINLQPAFVLNNGIMLQSTMTGKTDWWRNHLYDPSFKRAEDRELFCRAFPDGTFAKIQEPLVFYREGYRKPSDDLRVYLLSGYYDRLIIKMYGPSMAGQLRSLLLRLESRLKGLAYTAFTALGLQSMLIGQRNTSIDDEEKSTVQAVVTSILNTPVPGI